MSAARFTLAACPAAQSDDAEPHPDPLPPHRVRLDCESLHGFPDCMGCAAMGAHACTCETLTPEQLDLCLADAWDDYTRRGGEPCVDCAFRAGSPEQDDLALIAASPEPFRCHQGMPVDARGGVPLKDAYRPPLVRTEGGHITNDAYPICAGWARARAALARRENTKPPPAEADGA